MEKNNSPINVSLEGIETITSIYDCPQQILQDEPEMESYAERVVYNQATRLLIEKLREHKDIKTLVNIGKIKKEFVNRASNYSVVNFSLNIYIYKIVEGK